MVAMAAAAIAAALPATLAARVTAIESGPGLPDKFITSIAKDARGLMWIATRGGLCSFDGVRFGAVRAGIPAGIAVSKILYRPADDRLWVATAQGLYALRCNAIDTVRIPAETGWIRGAVSDIFLLPDDRLIAAYRSGEIVVVEKDDRMRVLARLGKSLSPRSYATNLRTADAGTIAFDPIGARVPQILSLASGAIRPDTTGGNMPTFFRQAVGDTLLIGRGSGGLEILHRNTRQPLFPAAAPLLARLHDITDVRFASPTSAYILCKQSELYFFDGVRAVLDTLASPVFSGKLGTCLFLDGDGLVWVGTNKGLVRASRDAPLFRTELAKPPASVRSLAVDEKGTLYAGTYSGLFRKSAGEARWIHISDTLAYAMLNRPGRYLYLVTEGGQFLRMDKASSRIEGGFFSQKDLPVAGLRGAYSLVADAQGRMWIGAREGLLQFDTTSSVLNLLQVSGLPAGQAVIHLRPSRRGTLWLCTRAGLYEYDPARGAVVWHIGADTQPALASSAVHFADEDQSGRIWVCTDGGGLNIVTADRKKVKVLKTEAGLADNSTYHLLWERNNQRAWISTFNGLSTYTPATGTFHNYYAEEGLAAAEFNHNAFLQEPSGRILFGGILGLTSFFPDSIPAVSRRSQLFVSGISKWDESSGAFKHYAPADTGTTIRLAPRDHSLTFTLALTDYDNPEAQIFQYRIQGLFDDWVSLGPDRTLRLDGLRPGSYALELRATDSRGTPAVNRLHYRIRVEQAFYKSVLFYVLLFALASALLAGFFALRVRHLRRVQRLRSQIASDLHDEVGSLLTRITITTDQLQYNSGATEEERRGKLQKIAALSRSAASSMSDILWAIDARNDYTGNLADRIREHAEEALGPLGIQPEFDFVVQQRMQLDSTLRQQLYIILKEAVNNVAKHSRPSLVRIYYHHDESGYTLRITNDGVAETGRASSKGQGLRNMQMRAEKVGAEAKSWREHDEFVVEVKG